MTPDETLMSLIRQKWGTMIALAVASSSVPAAFLAALIAGESGGNAEATRYEPEVYKRLAVKEHAWDVQRLTDNSTSWGLTQIMGENYPGPPEDLADPQTNLTFAVTMLIRFAREFHLDLRSDFEKLFRCWNTGRDDRPTYDPNYVPNGLRRMQIWNDLQNQITDPDLAI
jgi:hypothetical protein